MNAKRRYYTHYPRPILWLIPGGELTGEKVVEIAPFYLSKSPVTNEQLEAFEPEFVRSALSPDDRDPAVGVSHDLARAYCEWYAEVARKPMRLPTEEEWQYACRGGSDGLLYCEREELDDFAWHRSNSGGRVQPPDKKSPNPFGLNGMLGNTWDWVDQPTDSGEVAVLCGGSFRSNPDDLDCRLRKIESVSSSPGDAGFRIAKSLGR